jgi:hypothetical protein
MANGKIRTARRLLDDRAYYDHDDMEMENAIRWTFRSSL